MASLDRKRLRGVARTVALGAVLGVAGGYAVFYAVFPVAGVPGTSEASIPFVLVLLSFTSVLVGLATENLVEMVFQAFVGLFLSGAVASAMALSPWFLGVVFISPATIPAFLIQYGFILFVISFIVNLMGGTVGLVLRERYFIRGTRRPSAWAERK